MAQFWEKKKEKRRSGLFWGVLATAFGALFLIPPSWWGFLGLSGGFHFRGSFDETFSQDRFAPKPVAIPARKPSFLLAGQLGRLGEIPWDQKLGRPVSVLGLLNPSEARERPNSVYVKKDPFPNSDVSVNEGDLLSWALSQEPSVGKASSVMVRRVGRVSRRAKTSQFTQTFNSRSSGCIDGPSCAMMQLAKAKAESSFLCKNDGCSSSIEYESSELSSIFDGSDGRYRSLVMVQGNGSSSAPEIHKLGVPLF